ncbi:MAG: hypothetical protein K2N44_05460 [Lachnospiraceae bacterium]|nr:hypothetical protein [Lachnospiraceae bacterium]
MTKNIIVVDEHGKKYGTTYLKRAKGLVKQGRARFLARNMLCLACPPEQNLEDKDMSEQTMENTATEKESMEQEGSKYSVEYCIEQIERIGHQAEDLNQVLTELHSMEMAMALGNIVEHREKTTQQMLRFYEKMYDDLKAPVAVDVVAQKVRLQEQLLKIMDKTLENGDFSSDDILDMFNGAYDAIRHIGD